MIKFKKLMDLNDTTCKVVLVGDTGVGKTCIIKRFVNDEYSEIMEATISSTYICKTIDIKKYKKLITYNIWDTAGQEMYRALAQNFYLNASIGILVYDIRARESFNSIKDYWYPQLIETGEENMIIGIAANKCDLFQEEEVSKEEGEKYAKSIGAVFQLTSCSENIGIDDLFQECGEKYFEANKLFHKTESIKIKKDIHNNKKKNKKKKCC